MDIVSHGLWAGAACKAANKNKYKKFNVKAAAFWGMFPDFFAFTVPSVWILSSLILGNMTIDELPPHLAAMEPAQSDTLFVLRLTSMLYNISHSVFIFLLIFCLVYLFEQENTVDNGRLAFTYNNRHTNSLLQFLPYAFFVACFTMEIQRFSMEQSLVHANKLFGYNYRVSPA